MEKIIEDNAALGTGHCAAEHDEVGDEKLRLPEMTRCACNDKRMLLSTLGMQAQRDCAFRGQVEPTLLRWESIKFAVESNPNSKCYGHKKIIFQGAMRKNGQLTALKPAQEKSKYEMEAFENPDGACCLCKLLIMLRNCRAPNQVRVFCKLTKDQLCKDKCCCNPHQKNSKSQHSNMIRSIAAKAGFANTQRCAGHALRKRAHDLQAYGQVPLGVLQCVFNARN